MSDSINKEKISFIQYQTPYLTSGKYTLNLTHKIVTPSGGVTYSKDKTFYVLGDRFSLKPTDIHSTFPPANNMGNNSHIFPQIVLNRSTLPWERPADSRDELLPWLWLFIYDDEDITKGNVESPKNMEIQDIISQLKLQSQPLENNSAKANTISMNIDWLKDQNIIPTPSALKLLTSVRANYTTGIAKPNSERAVCIANRLPRPGVKTYAHLLSLESRFSGEKFNFPTDPKIKEISFVSLVNWNFTSTELSQYGTFKGVIENLNAGMFKLNKNNEKLTQYIDRGATPMPHKMRNGNKTISWYHGPLLGGDNPDAIPKNAHPVRSSDELLRYDKSIGMFDTTYAAAWQLGRLLMLNNRPLSMDLYLWKRQHSWQLNSLEKDIYKDKLPFVETDVSTNADSSYGNKLLSWFQGLSLLKNIPFNYLVPNEELLPNESIRFFSLDQFWINSLIDGAFSIGRVTKSDHQLDAQLGPKITPENGKITGFIIKSEAVVGWPSMQADGYSQKALVNSETIPGPPLPILRMERIASDTLICLFQGTLNTLDLHLKPEAIHFGLEPLGADQKQYQKILKNLDTGDLNNKEEISVEWLSEPDRIIDIDQLAKNIESKLLSTANPHGPGVSVLEKDPASVLMGLAKKYLGIKSGNFTSAQFAFEMVEGVPRVRFLSS